LNKKTEITNIGQELQTPTQSNPEKKRRTEEEHQDSSAFFCLPCPPWEWRSRLRHRAGDASGMTAVGCLEREREREQGVCEQGEGRVYTEEVGRSGGGAGVYKPELAHSRKQRALAK